MKKYLFILLFIFNNLAYAQWPQWRGPMRDGFSPETNLLKSWPAEGPRLLWSCDTIGDGYSSAIIQDKTIYITGKRDTARIMTALDLNGKIIWQKEIGKTKSEEDLGECSTPTLYQDKLYTVTVPGDICCVDTGTGTADWEISIPNQLGETSHFCESLLVVDNKVMVTPFGEKTTLIALNRVTGKTIWQSEHIADKTAYVSPILVQGQDKKIVVTNGREHIIAADVDTGEIKWQENISSETFIPLADKNRIYFPSCMMLNINPDLSGFNAQWQDNSKRKTFGGAVKLGNRIYGTFEEEAGIFCLDWDTGKQLTLNTKIKGANLLAADGMIYSYEQNNGRVSLLKPTDNSIDIVGSFEVKPGEGEHLAHMSIGNGILFVRHGNVLMAYDIKQTQSGTKTAP
ncbi:MAG: PQQ-binding-like beta-propeller repeat protein [Sedimentisphaerales bacterium]|nr:PQQ-binding-like beta-propeller repeat protein [Sedimentisphaerales bacterium]